MHVTRLSPTGIHGKLVHHKLREPSIGFVFQIDYYLFRNATLTMHAASSHTRKGMNRLLRLASIVLLYGLILGTAGAFPDPYKDERAQYRDAVRALSRGQYEQFEQLTDQLKDYPLHPYLLDKSLRRSLSRADDADIASFLETYADTPLAVRLYDDWMEYLGRTRQWKRYENFYQGGDAELRCFHLRATRGTRDREQWLQAAYDLWLVGHSQPDECDPVFKVLYDSDRIDDDAIWTRIELAMDNGKLSLARFLGKKLPAADQKWVDLWRYAHRRPASALTDGRLKSDRPIALRIRLHAIERLARSHPDTAYEKLTPLQGRVADKDYYTTLQTVARYAGYRRSDNAYRILAAVPDAYRDEKIEDLQARIALQNKDWSALAQTIEGFTHHDSRFSEWPYWHARALLHLNRRDPALQLLRDLAQERYFHGFLAADYLNLPYRLNRETIDYSEDKLLDLLKRHPGLQRAGELHRLGQTWTSRREWYYACKQLSQSDLELAAALAHEWGWHDRAIWTAARAGRWDDVDIRFPLAYRGQVEQVAGQFKLDPALIYGIIRQESAFMADAHSAAGALGLMQLMPATGAHTARLLRLPKPSRSTLLQTSANLRLGSGYLKRMLDRYNGNPALAAAAYNAGPHRVDRWLPDSGSESVDYWIDTIPFRETRGYVRGVLAFTTVYDMRMNTRPTTLAERLNEVSKKVN